MSKIILRRAFNRVFHTVARNCPGSTTLRPALHRWRGVKMGRDVFIGDGVYLDNEYPECIEIQDNVQISIRAIVIAHTRGPGKVIIEKAAFVGPNAVIVCGAGRTLRIGGGAVVGAGSVVTKSVPPGLFVSPPAPTPMARVRVPLPLAKTMDEFWAGLVSLEDKDP
jgi:acetyltransferase-like isoleucine patch superfamily enzyme